MKILERTRVIDAGRYSQSGEWFAIESQIEQAIMSIEWPKGSGTFTLHDEFGKERGKGNGVKPIKDACMTVLKERFGWELETPCNIISDSRYGDFDATLKSAGRLFCVEWETGNISSSHRSMNKMAFGIQKEILVGGALILPTRTMYRYLTDRVGNYRELAPYFPFWKACGNTIKNGLLVVYAIEHDAVSKDVPRITKGTDGRALV